MPKPAGQVCQPACCVPVTPPPHFARREVHRDGGGPGGRRRGGPDAHILHFSVTFSRLGPQGLRVEVIDLLSDQAGCRPAGNIPLRDTSRTKPPPANPEGSLWRYYRPPQACFLARFRLRTSEAVHEAGRVWAACVGMRGIAACTRTPPCMLVTSAVHAVDGCTRHAYRVGHIGGWPAC